MELAASRVRLVTTADEARRRIERDLHDGAQQRLVSLTLQLRRLHADVPPEQLELGESLNRCAEELTKIFEEVRELARGLHPGLLAQGGLGPALRALPLRSTVPVQLTVMGEEGLPERVEVAAYYVVSETLTNAAKHAEASVIQVDVRGVDALLHVRVSDDGHGGAEFARALA